MRSGGQAATLDIVEMNGNGWHCSPALKIISLKVLCYIYTVTQAA